MERELYRILDIDYRISKLNNHFELSHQFEWLHDNYIKIQDSRKYFELHPYIKVKRRDQLILNLQYNNLLYSCNIYNFIDYCSYAEEFFTYFLNYELTTGRCSPQFPNIIKTIFNILNKYTNNTL